MGLTVVWCIASSDYNFTTLHRGLWSQLTSVIRYLLQNFEWLDEELGEYEDDYLLIDCPGEITVIGPVLILTKWLGQIELYTHHSILPTLVSHFQQLGIRTSAVYLLESQFMEDKYKFFR